MLLSEQLQASNAEARIFLRKGRLPWPNTDWHGFGCFALLFLQALLEICISILTAPFRKSEEVPNVTCLMTSENENVLQAMPSLSVFHPTWWALGPFAQTVVHGSRAITNATPYTREHLVLRDGVAVALDWKVVDPNLPPEAPIVVVCHGLGGNSMTNSCNGVTEALARRGWRVVVYNRRGHGGTSLLAAAAVQEGVAGKMEWAYTRMEDSPSEHSTSRVEPEDADAGANTACQGQARLQAALHVKARARLDMSGGVVQAHAQAQARVQLLKAFPAHVDLDDLRRVVAHVVAHYPAAPKALVGLSAGSNLVVRFQGDCAAESPFLAAASIANGHELTHLTKALLKKPLTDLLLVTFLKEVLYDRFQEVQQLTAAAGLAVDWGRLLAARHTRDFEAHLTARVWGYTDVDDYYGANHCFQSFKHVLAPLLSLSNSDDPVIDPQLMGYAQEAARINPRVLSVATVRGGHLGWLQGTTARPWMHDVLAEFLQHAFSRAAAPAAASTGSAQTAADGTAAATPAEAKDAATACAAAAATHEAAVLPYCNRSSMGHG